MIDQGIRRFSSLVVSLCREEQTVSARGLLQLLDARVKILFLALFVIIVSLKQDIFGEAVIALGLLVLAVSSRIPLGRFYSRIAGFAFFFGFLIAVPATLNLIVPGDVVLPLVTLERAHDFWVYHIPREIGLTAQGIHAAAMLCLRVMNSLTISLLVLYTTPVAQIVGALKVFRIPAAFVLIITLSVKYIAVFSRNIEEMYLARKGRSTTAQTRSGGKNVDCGPYRLSFPENGETL